MISDTYVVSSRYIFTRVVQSRSGFIILLSSWMIIIIIIIWESPSSSITASSWSDSSLQHAELEKNIVNNTQYATILNCHQNVAASPLPLYHYVLDSSFLIDNVCFTFVSVHILKFKSSARARVSSVSVCSLTRIWVEMTPVLHNSLELLHSTETAFVRLEELQRLSWSCMRPPQGIQVNSLEKSHIRQSLPKKRNVKETKRSTSDLSETRITKRADK